MDSRSAAVEGNRGCPHHGLYGVLAEVDLALARPQILLLKKNRIKSERRKGTKGGSAQNKRRKASELSVD